MKKIYLIHQVSFISENTYDNVLYAVTSAEQALTDVERFTTEAAKKNTETIRNLYYSVEIKLFD